MEVNDITQANPALPHNNKGVNILYADFHAETIVLKSIRKQLRLPTITGNGIVDSWESEFVNGSGVPVDLTSKQMTLEQAGLGRNPNMPYYWSIPGQAVPPGSVSRIRYLLRELEPAASRLREAAGCIM